MANTNDGLSKHPVSARETHRARLSALAAILLAWLLGAWQLAEQSMWIDEWFTNMIAGQPWENFLATVMATERRPPLHYTLLKLWSSVAGPQEIVLRFYSVGMVALSVALLYALGRKLLRPSAAAVGAWLLAASPFWLLYGRMIRAYSQTMMLALAATLLLVVAVQGSRRWWLSYTAAAIALIYTDYSGLPILLAHGVYVLALLPQTRKALPAWLLAMAVTALAYLPWLPNILEAGGRTVRITDLAGGPLGFAVKLAMPLYVWASGETLYPWSLWGAAAALTLGLAALGGLYSTWRSKRATFWLLLAWLALPLLFTATLLSVLATDITFLNAGSRTPGAAPAYALAAAAGLAALPRRSLRAVAAVCIAAGMIAATVNYYSGVQFLNPIYALPTRALAAELAAAAGPGDLILAESDTLFGYYYTQHPGAAVYQDVDPAVNLAWIDEHDPPTVWLAGFGRDSTEGVFGTADLRAGLQADYAAGTSRGYGPVEPFYQSVKQRLTGRPPYPFKLTLQPFTRLPAAD